MHHFVPFYLLFCILSILKWIFEISIQYAHSHVCFNIHLWQSFLQNSRIMSQCHMQISEFDPDISQISKYYHGTNWLLLWQKSIGTHYGWKMSLSHKGASGYLHFLSIKILMVPTFILCLKMWVQTCMGTLWLIRFWWGLEFRICSKTSQNPSSSLWILQQCFQLKNMFILWGKDVDWNPW